MQAHDPVKTANMFSSLTNTSSVDSGSTRTSSLSSGTLTPSATSYKKKAKSKKKKNPTKADQAVITDSNSSSVDEKKGLNLTLAQRLDVAAAIDDTHAALVGLLGWSRLYVHTETILTFFQSDALSILLRNLLRSRPGVAMLDNLETLLANCLSVESTSEPANATETAPHQQMAKVVVAAVKAITDQMQGIVEITEDVQLDAELAVKSLSQLVRAHALSLHGVDLNSPLMKDVQNLEVKIAQVTSADEAVRGQTIRESFQRRDLRSDALAMHEKRLQKLIQLVEERVRSSEQPHELDGELENEDAILDDEIQIAEDEARMQEVVKSLQEMQDCKDAELVALRERNTVVSTEVLTLRRKKEELEAQLQLVVSELQRAIGEQHQVEKDLCAVEERFMADAARFRAEHQHVMRRFSRAQRRRVITTEVTRVANEVRQARLAHSQVHTLRAKLTACVSQELEGSLHYFESELPCVKFMISRVKENEAKLASMLGEIVSYRALGVTAIALELENKTAEIEAHLIEDKNCLSALHKRDEELLDNMRRLLIDTSLRDAVADVDEKVKHDSQRMIDYVGKLYDEMNSSKTSKN